MTHTPLSDYDRGVLEGLLTQHNASGAINAELRRRLTCSEHHNCRLRIALTFAAAIIAVLLLVCAALLVGRLG